jgi:hypothetical protein
MKAYAQGWIVPSPEEPKKSMGEFEEERRRLYHALTAACLEIPPPLIEQLRTEGRLIALVMELGVQRILFCLKKALEASRNALSVRCYMSP